jgi:hypothetical protein
MAQDDLKILQMVADHKITAEQGLELLQALGETPGAPEPPARKPRWLRVEVTDPNTGMSTVNARIPLSLAKLGMKMGGKWGGDTGEHGVDLGALARAVDDGLAEGDTLVEVQDGEHGEHVRVWVE